MSPMSLNEPHDGDGDEHSITIHSFYARSSQDQIVARRSRAANRSQEQEQPREIGAPRSVGQQSGTAEYFAKIMIGIISCRKGMNHKNMYKIKSSALVCSMSIGSA